jgi:hypothetical protein
MDISNSIINSINIKGIKGDIVLSQEFSSRKTLKVILYLASLGWTIYLVIKYWDTTCFSFFDSYITVLTLLGSMIVNDLMRQS